MLSPSNITKLESIANSKSQSLSQVIRNAIESYDPIAEQTQDEQILADLISLVNESTKKAEASLTKGLTDVEKALEELRNGND